MGKIYKVTSNKSKTEDIFGRKEYASKIWRLINWEWREWFVLSVNSSWWEWKTTFLKDIFIPCMEWENFNVVYFDAFEHDFFDNPLSAITGSFLKWVWLEGKDKIRTGAKKFLKVWWKVLLRYAMRGDIPEIENNTESSIEDTISNFAVNELDSYLEAEKWVKEFKMCLEEFSNELDQPLVFIVDELDRCKPSFALEVIEVIKHFFSLKNVVFILSINKKQITNYISHQYWNSSDSENYLHKFIDIETDLPSDSINIKKYLKNMISSHFFPVSRYNYWEIYPLTEWLDISLREFEKICNYIKLMYLSADSSPCDLEVCFMLSYIKVKNHRLYNDLLNLKYVSHDELHNELKTQYDDKTHLKQVIDYIFNPNCKESIKNDYNTMLASWRIHWWEKNKKFLIYHFNLLKNFS